MIETLVPTKKPQRDKKPQLSRPREVRILLIVCSCYSSLVVTLMKASAREVAKILRIDVSELEILAVKAMLSGNPQIVGCHTSDVAETILAKLNDYTPFIARGCHSFCLD